MGKIIRRIRERESQLKSRQVHQKMIQAQVDFWRELGFGEPGQVVPIMPPPPRPWWRFW